MSLKQTHGFTLLELLIVLTISSMLIVAGIVLVSTMLNRNHIDQATQDVVSTLRRAQWQTMTGHEDTEWGVHFTSTDMTLFQGASYVPADPENVIVELPDSVTLSTINLAGGGNDVVFLSEFGGTTQDGTLILDHVASDETAMATINSVGMIDWN